MFKKTIVFIATSILFILLTSCDQYSETAEVKPLLEVVEKVEINEGEAAIDQEVKAKSAMEKIDPEVLATLDILTDYDEDIKYGPENWDEETWDWKIILKWDRECDYRPWVTEYPLHDSKYSFIVVECHGGAYQPTSYTYLLDKNTKQSIQLSLGRTIDSPDLLKETLGEITMDVDTNELSIITVVRGIRDCGTYRKFDFVEGDSVKASKFIVKSTRKQECLEGMRYEDLPDSVFDYKNWPIVDE